MSLARRIASASSSNGSTATTGPKISSLRDAVAAARRARRPARTRIRRRSGAEPRKATRESSRNDATVSRCAAEISGPISVASSRGIADPPVGDGRFEQLEEAVVHAPLHEDAAARAAVLARVVEHRARRRRRRPLEVGVREDDVGALAAEFERDGLERAGAAGRDIRPDLGRSGEHDLAHVGVRHEPLPDDRARAGHAPGTGPRAGPPRARARRGASPSAASARRA